MTNIKFTRRRSFAWLFAACPFLTMNEASAMNDVAASPPHDAYREFPSPFAFQETVSRLEAAMAKAGLTVFARIDHAAGAVQVGLTLPPTLVLIYGNARGGTPLMLADPAVALDLPLRVLIREEEVDKVFVAYHPVAVALRRPGIAEALWMRLEPAQQLLLDALKS